MEKGQKSEESSFKTFNTCFFFDTLEKRQPVVMPTDKSHSLSDQ